MGYGDQFPVTGQGRLIAVGLMLAGIALLGVVTATIARRGSWSASARSRLLSNRPSVILMSSWQSCRRFVESCATAGLGRYRHRTGSRCTGRGIRRPGYVAAYVSAGVSVPSALCMEGCSVITARS